MQNTIFSLRRWLKHIFGEFDIASNARLQRELEQSKRAEAELAKRNHFLQHILDASTTRIWHFDREVRVVSLNKAAQENLEYQLEYYIGKTAFEYFHDIDDAQLYYELDIQVLHTGIPDIGRLDVYQSPGGEAYYKKVDRIPYYDEHDEIAGITVYSYDITEQKRAEVRLLEQRLELEDEIKKRIVAEKELRRLATTDPLTGIFNRRHFFELLEAELARTKRTGKSFSIVLFDIDHFKQINDSYGHQAGDEVLRRVTRACRDHLRQMDGFARYGGEEFIILLPELEIHQAQQAAEKIRGLIAGQIIEFEKQSITVTISLGVSELADGEPLDQLLARVDKALYQAKEGGRNRVRVVGHA